MYQRLKEHLSKRKEEGLMSVLFINSLDGITDMGDDSFNIWSQFQSHKTLKIFLSQTTSEAENISICPVNSFNVYLNNKMKLIGKFEQ